MDDKSKVPRFLAHHVQQSSGSDRVAFSQWNQQPAIEKKVNTQQACLHHYLTSVRADTMTANDSVTLPP